MLLAAGEDKLAFGATDNVRGPYIIFSLSSIGSSPNKARACTNKSSRGSSLRKGIVESENMNHRMVWTLHCSSTYQILGSAVV